MSNRQAPVAVTATQSAWVACPGCDVPQPVDLAVTAGRTATGGVEVVVRVADLRRAAGDLTLHAARAHNAQVADGAAVAAWVEPALTGACRRLADAVTAAAKAVL